MSVHDSRDPELLGITLAHVAQTQRAGGLALTLSEAADLARVTLEEHVPDFGSSEASAERARMNGRWTASTAYYSRGSAVGSVDASSASEPAAE